MGRFTFKFWAECGSYTNLINRSFFLSLLQTWSPQLPRTPTSYKLSSSPIHTFLKQVWRQNLGCSQHLNSFCLLAILTVLQLPQTAQGFSTSSAQIEIDRYYYLLDESGEMTREKMLSLYRDGDERLQFGEFATFGLTQASIWLVLPIDTTQFTESNWILHFLNPTLDHIAVHQYEEGHLISSQKMGDKYPFNQRPIEYNQFALPLEITPETETLLVLQVQSIGAPVVFGTYLDTPTQFQHRLLQNYLWQGSYFGIMLVMILYNFFIFLSIKDKSYLFYTVYVLFACLYQACIQGIGFQYLWPSSPAFNFSFVFVVASLVIFFGGLFTLSFLNLDHISQRTRKWLAVAFTIFGLNAFTIYLLPVNWAMNTTALTSALGYLTIIGCGVSALRQGYRPALFFLIGWVSLTLLVIAGMACYYRILNSPLIGQYATQWGTAIEVTLLSLALASRINLLRTEKQESSEKEAIAKAESSAKSQFLAEMSHEIRTPMNGVLGMTEILKDSGLTQNQIQYVDIIHSSGQSLLTIINDILDYSKIEAGKIELEQNQFNLEKYINDCTSVFSLNAHQKNIDFTCYIHPSTPKCTLGDPSRLRQIIVNLLSNAFKFTETGSVRLVIEPIQQDDAQVTLQFEVIDTGIGISPENQRKLFIAFQQAESSTSRMYGGTGLGLTICKKLVELMDGDIGVNSIEGAGSTFYFTAKLGIESQTDQNKDLNLLKGRTFYYIDNDLYYLQKLRSMADHYGLRVIIPKSLDHAPKHLAALTQRENVDGVILSSNVLPDLTKEDVKTILGVQPNLVLTPIRDRQKVIGKLYSDYDKLNVQSVTEKPATINLLLYLFAGLIDPDNFETSLDLNKDSNSLSQYPSLRVLVAEDNIVNQKVIKAQLNKLGVTPKLAVDGSEAVVLFQQEEFDLVFMDCEMPRLDGFQAARHIREWEKQYNKMPTPIVALTAHVLQEHIDKIMASGMSAHLSKPINVQALQSTIAEWVDHSQQSASSG